jgi:hypothetical protein
MREMASEHNTTTFLPLPIDLFSAFLEKRIGWNEKEFLLEFRL